MSEENNKKDTQKMASALPKLEEEVLAFWQKEKIFERSVNERPENKAYVFYDGPPYATGLPHIGHLLASTIKDIVPRYKTMKGYRVERRFGWDCHGLPIEVLVEKELGFKSRKDIETYGIGKFNEYCRATVLRYVDEWRRTITRFGRWVDFDNDYKTMDPDYMESVIWVFAELYKKNLIYEDYRSSLYCTRCETPLSKMETAMDNSYKDVEDPSIYVAFAVDKQPHTYFLSWTTTPWTLSANVALAIKEDAEYVDVELTSGRAPWFGRHLILARERLPYVFPEGGYRQHKIYSGSDLIGWKYKQLQPFMKPEGDAFRVVTAPFVSLDDGTGIVHIAPAFGEDDFTLSKTENLPILLTVDNSGRFLPEITPWAGQHVKAADPSIIEALHKQGVLYKEEKIIHSYPFCWRCSTPLIYKVQQSWYVKVEALKKKMISSNKKINWVPDYLKEGRFALGVAAAPDWGISRSRFWGVPIPVWRCDRCNKEKVAGSLDELEQFSGKRPHDLHRPIIDEIAWACACGGTFTRVAEVLDVWFDSGAMPYGQVHYPFQNKEKFEATFPADFITEYIGQVRGWFYYLHVFSNALLGKESFSNCLTTGTILGEDGSKMSKSKGNMPNVNILFDRYGSDAMRLYLLGSSVMSGDAVCYREDDIVEEMRKVLMPLLNVFSFFKLYASEGEKLKPMRAPKHVLDRWILARLESTRQEVENAMEAYELMTAARVLAPFVNDLSTWYLRRSRERFKGDDASDRSAAIMTLYSVLLTTTKVFAPFTPFLSEYLYQSLKPWSVKSKDSVHLESWPRAHKEFVDEALNKEMALARQIVELGHARRAELAIKVRQPLQAVLVSSVKDTSIAVKTLVIEELNVMKWVDVKGAELSVDLDTKMTPELQQQGLHRELVRQINALRKKQGLTIHDRVHIIFSTDSQSLQELILSEIDTLKREVLAEAIEQGEGEQEIKVDDAIVKLTLKS